MIHDEHAKAQIQTDVFIKFWWRTQSSLNVDSKHGQWTTGARCFRGQRCLPGFIDHPSSLKSYEFAPIVGAASSHFGTELPCEPIFCKKNCDTALSFEVDEQSFYPLKEKHSSSMIYKASRSPVRTSINHLSDDSSHTHPAGSSAGRRHRGTSPRQEGVRWSRTLTWNRHCRSWLQRMVQACSASASAPASPSSPSSVPSPSSPSSPSSASSPWSAWSSSSSSSCGATSTASAAPGSSDSASAQEEEKEMPWWIF